MSMFVDLRAELGIMQLHPVKVHKARKMVLCAVAMIVGQSKDECRRGGNRNASTGWTLSVVESMKEGLALMTKRGRQRIAEVHVIDELSDISREFTVPLGISLILKLVYAHLFMSDPAFLFLLLSLRCRVLLVRS